MVRRNKHCLTKGLLWHSNTVVSTVHCGKATTESSALWNAWFSRMRSGPVGRAGDVYVHLTALNRQMAETRAERLTENLSTQNDFYVIFKRGASLEFLPSSMVRPALQSRAQARWTKGKWMALAVPLSLLGGFGKSYLNGKAERLKGRQTEEANIFLRQGIYLFIKYFSQFLIVLRGVHIMRFIPGQIMREAGRCMVRIQEWPLLKLYLKTNLP